LTFSGLQSVVFQKTQLLITTAVKNLKSYKGEEKGAEEDEVTTKFTASETSTFSLTKLWK
jgi:hypothetical protein